MEILAQIRDSLPVPLMIALTLCLPIWALSEGATEAMNGAKAKWWGWLIVRLLPFIIGVGICVTPGVFDVLWSGLLGYPERDLLLKTKIGYGVHAGAFAMAAHAFGARPAFEAFIRKVAQLVGKRLGVEPEDGVGVKKKGKK